MSMKLVILGILMEGEKHPYDIQQFIKHREMEKYIKFQKGSLYYAVEQLEKSGFVEVVTVVRETNRPDKTIYRITESGKMEFHKLLLKQFTTVEHYNNPLFSAFAFVSNMDKKELLDSLEIRIRDSELMLSMVEIMYKKYEGNIPRYGLHMMACGIEHIKTDLRWLKDVLKDAKEDRLTGYGGLDRVND